MVKVVLKDLQSRSMTIMARKYTSSGHGDCHEQTEPSIKIQIITFTGYGNRVLAGKIKYEDLEKLNLESLMR